jgi:hypothetical protein
MSQETGLATSSTSSSELTKSRRPLRDSKALLRLEEAAGGRDGLARQLAFLPAPTTPEKTLLELLDAGVDRPLAELLREANLTPGALASSIASAKIEFEREVAKAAAVEAAPEVIDRLIYHAKPQVRRCPRLCTRTPTGGVKTMVMLGTQESICPQCDGAGAYPQESEHMPWAADKLLRIGLPEDKGPGVQVNVQNNMNMKAGTSNLIADLARTVHAASMVRALPPAERVVDAEVVK